LNPLARGNKSSGYLGIAMTVGVGDESPGEAQDPRIAGERSGGQFGQLSAKAWPQVVADFADLLFDEVVVVEQPFRSRNYSSAAPQPSPDPPSAPAATFPAQ
jgi:hypothetical protein